MNKGCIDCGETINPWQKRCQECQRVHRNKLSSERKRRNRAKNPEHYREYNRKYSLMDYHRRKARCNAVDVDMSWLIKEYFME